MTKLDIWLCLIMACAIVWAGVITYIVRSFL